MPFRSYIDFMFFMERRWEKTGNDQKYREAMEYLRDAETPYESEAIRTQIESRRILEARGRRQTSESPKQRTGANP
jgi:hypothetical protein